MSKEKWCETKFKLSNGKSVCVIHNIQQPGNINSIDAAFDNRINRTNTYTATSFVQYINSKGIHKAFTKQQYLKLKR